MQTRRGMDNLRNLTNGPGKLTKALGITMNDYGHSFFTPPLYITLGIVPDDISIGPRIGINNTGRSKRLSLSILDDGKSLCISPSKTGTQNHELLLFLL